MYMKKANTKRNYKKYRLLAHCVKLKKKLKENKVGVTQLKKIAKWQTVMCLMKL